MNVVNMQHIGFAFQPIEDDSSSSSSAMEFEQVAASSTEIFRDITMEDTSEDNNNNKTYMVSRAKPIDSSESDDRMERRVISPFTHSTSWEDQQQQQQQQQQQREEKLTPLDWSTSDEHPCIVDFSLLFQPNTFASNIDFMDCNDDFSLSSCEANSMCKHLDIESISDDPSSFWESGASVDIYLDRSSSPNDISLDHSA